MTRFKSIILESIDRCGKSSLSEDLQDALGYHLVIHYEKPKKLEAYKHAIDPLEHYQEQSFITMFNLLTASSRLILDRAHLGEYVYSPRYRGYDGSYVFDMEQQFIEAGSQFHETTLLVLLTTTDFSIMKDDGLSFDFSKREEEQVDFIKAFNQSHIKNKLLIDVSNGKGGYRTRKSVLKQVLDVYHG